MFKLSKNLHPNRTKKRKVQHELITAPNVGKEFSGQKWDRTAKVKYHQFICNGPGYKLQVWIYG